jgi:hypothetical protein
MEEFLPVNEAMAKGVSPDMLTEHDFGPGLGRRLAISLRDFLIHNGIGKAEMQTMDRKRQAKGLPPLWEDS